jgi:hypothetical protein
MYGRGHTEGRFVREWMSCVSSLSWRPYRRFASRVSVTRLLTGTNDHPWTPAVSTRAGSSSPTPVPSTPFPYLLFLGFAGRRRDLAGRHEVPNILLQKLVVVIKLVVLLLNCLDPVEQNNKGVLQCFGVSRLMSATKRPKQTLG